MDKRSSDRAERERKNILDRISEADKGREIRQQRPLMGNITTLMLDTVPEWRKP